MILLISVPPEVQHNPEKWCLEDFLLSFWCPRPIFRGELLNFGRVEVHKLKP